MTYFGLVGIGHDLVPKVWLFLAFSWLFLS